MKVIFKDILSQQYPYKNIHKNYKFLHSTLYENNNKEKRNPIY